MSWITRLRYYAEILKVNYWLIPVAMIVISIILARLVLLFPSHTELNMPAVRSLFDTVGMASISLAGVTFSITIVALTLASQQFGPRTLRNFLGDRANQYTLGTFVATYSFCLALSGMPDALGVAIPQAATLLTYVLAFHCIIVFVLFIHHVANGIRGPSILHNLHREAHEVLTRILPTEEKAEQTPCLPKGFADDAEDVILTTAGFLQAVDHQSLVKLASRHDLVIEITGRTGQFVSLNSRIARVKGKLTDKLKDDISRHVAIGGVRTPEQDPQYLPERIAELAVRALSPGVNDPFTASECIHWLGNLLQYAKRHPPQVPAYAGDNGELRLWVPKMTYKQLYDATLGTVRRYTDDDVLIKQLDDVSRRIKEV